MSFHFTNPKSVSGATFYLLDLFLTVISFQAAKIENFFHQHTFRPKQWRHYNSQTDTDSPLRSGIIKMIIQLDLNAGRCAKNTALALPMSLVFIIFASAKPVIGMPDLLPPARVGIM